MLDFSLLNGSKIYLADCWKFFCITVNNFYNIIKYNSVHLICISIDWSTDIIFSLKSLKFHSYFSVHRCPILDWFKNS